MGTALTQAFDDPLRRDQCGFFFFGHFLCLIRVSSSSSSSDASFYPSLTSSYDVESALSLLFFARATRSRA